VPLFGPTDSKDASRAVKEYLAILDDAAFGAASQVTPKFVSPFDPAAHCVSRPCWHFSSKTLPIALKYFKYFNRLNLQISYNVVPARTEFGESPVVLPRPTKSHGHRHACPA
jgi:hypothetical protein